LKAVIITVSSIYALSQVKSLLKRELGLEVGVEIFMDIPERQSLELLITTREGFYQDELKKIENLAITCRWEPRVVEI